MTIGKRIGLALLAAAFGCQQNRPASAPAVSSAGQELTALDCSHSEQYELSGIGGAMFNTLAVDTSILPMSQVGKVLANDQIHMLRMAQDAGLTIVDKHVPAFVIFDQNGNAVTVHSGGFYQCATLADCQGYLSQVVGTYTLDGTVFGARPEFHDTFQGHAYQVIGGAKFQDIPADYAIKITRWHIRAPSKWQPTGFLTQRWRNFMREEACNRGLAQAHLLWSEAEQVVAEVTIGTKVDVQPGPPYFVETLGALAGQPVLDDLFDQVPLERIPPAVTDTYLVLTYWPNGFASPGRWPNSPSATAGGPLPEPFCGDGSCNTTVTHSEDATSCPADCAPTCGNGQCDGGETPDTCAIDCRPM
jgi:hypothetical protein